MAEVISAPNKDDNLEDTLSTVEQKQDPQDELPEKYRGKSAAEIARMHQEAEKLFGKQSQELGQLRQNYDAVIQATLTKKAPANQQTSETQTDEFDEVEFFANPKQAVNKMLEKHPALQELRSAHVQEQQAKARKLFSDKHPDAQEILQSPEFHSWVASSKLRTNLLVQADKAFDVDAADELFSTWKQINKQSEKKQEIVDATQKAALKAGMVPTGASTSNSDEGGKKIYRRADIMKLMQTDPYRYELMADEITRAYQEGRVK